MKTNHLLKLPGAHKRLTLWKADLADEGGFDNAIDGCEGVFHVATAMDFESQDPEVLIFSSLSFLHILSYCLYFNCGSWDLLWQNEVIQPTVNGVLNVMRSCAKAKSVKRVIFTSSAGAVSFTDDYGTPGKIYDETCWTNVELCRSIKMTGWVRSLYYFIVSILNKLMYFYQN